MMNTATPLVSAIMPTFNASGHLAESIESILEQTYRNWELILVDDGSTDATLAIAQRYAALDERIKVFRIDHSGRGVARNVCLRHVRGKYVAMCDSDDISLPERFQQQVELLESDPEVGVVACHDVVGFSDEHSRTYLIHSPSTPRAIRRAFGRGRMPIQNASAMVRAELYRRYGEYDTQLRRAQDYEWFLRMYRDVRFVTTPALIRYRTGDLVVPRWHMTENNLYRYYATRRAKGDARTFQEFYRAPIPRLYRYLVVPAMYVWYVFKRRVLKSGISNHASGQPENAAKT